MTEELGSAYNPEVLAREIDNFRDQSEALADDLTPFIQIISMVQANERMHLATEIPKEYSWFTYISFDALSWDFVCAKVLKNLGSEHVLVESPGDRDYPIVCPDAVVAIYEKGSGFTTSIIKNIVSNRDYPTILELIYKMDAYTLPGAYVLDPNSRHSWLNDPRLVSIGDKELFERAFMTSVLRNIAGQIRTKLFYKNSLIFRDYLREPESIATYQKLSENGILPLGPEEVYGLMTSALTAYMDDHPADDVRPKLSKTF